MVIPIFTEKHFSSNPRIYNHYFVPQITYFL